MNQQAHSGQQLKLDGIDRATRSTWTARALAAIDTLARSGRRFTGEDVVAVVGAPSNFRAVGAVISLAARRGKIRTDGSTIPARDPKKHAHRNLVWRAA
ncbi:MAG: hypothetical protein ACYDC3_08295 [Candidatus Binataceae bacterium]